MILRAAEPPPSGFAPPGAAWAGALTHTLDPFAHRLPPELVPAGALARLRAATDRLPAALTRWIYLECRLVGGSGRTDLIIGVEPEGRDLLAGTNPALRLEPGLLARDAWERVAALCRRWADPSGPLSAAVDFLWLEFDLEADGDPVPGVFAGFRPPAAQTLRAGPDGLLREVLDPLLGGVSAPAGAALERCLRALPRGASVPYAGALVPRGDGRVRLCLAGLGSERLPGYLREVGWPGEPEELRALLRDTEEARGGGPEAGPGLVHLDVGAEVGPRVGMEFLLARPPQLRGRIAESDFLAHLEERGLCEPSRRRALEGWPGCSVERFPHELWASIARRWVNHVKLVHETGHPPRAKGYLTLSHRFRARRAGG